ncbi:MAG: hypothetical protein ACRDOK_16970 [Streptosporangiaceae bacterium]
MVAPLVFWLDQAYDREHAPDHVSRYGAEVRERSGEFARTWADISPVPFTVTAWQLATSLTSAYVRWHRRITAAACRSSPWDGSLICEVTMVAPWPAELRQTRAWCRDRGWRDWPQLFGQYAPPSEQDLTRAPHLRASLFIQALVPLDRLPPAPTGSADDAPGTARRAVAAVVRELNDLLTPMVSQLEAVTPAR